MDITDIIWLDVIVDKIWKKHRVKVEEIEEVLSSIPKVRYIEKGKVKGEDIYAAMGRTRGGRSLIIFLIMKQNKNALIVSARDMSRKERKRYEKK